MEPDEAVDMQACNTRDRRKTLWPAAAVVLLWGGMFCLSCWLVPCGAEAHAATDSIADALLGEVRLAFGKQFFDRADMYFHRGVEHEEEEALQDDVFARIGQEISPHEHVHAKGAGLKEIMPWLWLTMRVNPGEERPYLVAAFWLAGKDIGRPDLAHEVLAEAQRNVPRSYQVQMERGRLFLRQGEQESAARAFDAGLRFWPGNEDPQNPRSLLDKASLLVYRALLHEAEDNLEQAAADIQQVLELFPEREHLRHRLATLRTGERPSEDAATLWGRLLESGRQMRAEECPRETGHTGATGGHAHEHHE